MLLRVAPTNTTHTQLKIRTHLCADSDRKDIFDWFIRSMISCGHSARMSSFLEENGIKKEEIEAASVHPDGNYFFIFIFASFLAPFSMNLAHLTHV